MTDIAKLKELALAAIAEEGDDWYAAAQFSDCDGLNLGKADAKFIAAANPAAILELIERLERAEAKLAELEKQEPIYQFIMNRPDIDGYIEWVDCNKNYFDSCGDDIRRIIYAAPPAPFVVDSKSFERGLSILNETLDDCGDSERGLLLALTKMGVEVQGE